jgi:membrane-bound lytic murein transglycosylase B
MTGPVRSVSPADQRWAELAAQLTPAASITRIDTVTARAVTTVTVIGILITGFGALAAGQITQSRIAQHLAAATVIAATLAVACALMAQVLTVARQINPANLVEVQAWYRRQFGTRARATQAATILLVIAALLAGATAAATVLSARPIGHVATSSATRP